MLYIKMRHMGKKTQNIFMDSRTQLGAYTYRRADGYAKNTGRSCRSDQLQACISVALQFYLHISLPPSPQPTFHTTSLLHPPLPSHWSVTPHAAQRLPPLRMKAEAITAARRRLKLQ